MSKKEVALDIAMTLFLVLFPHFVPLPFYSYSIVCFIALLFYLKSNRKKLADLGLKKRGANFATIAIAVLSALFWVAFMRWVFVPSVSFFFSVPDYTEYNFIRNNVSNLVITIVAAWIVGGFYEEIVFRGFINSTSRKYFRFWASAIVTSLLFGAYHWQQGIFGIAAATLGGLYWTMLMRYFGKNLWISIFSHSIFDTITLILIYYGALGK